MLFKCNVIDRLCFAQSDVDLLFDKVDSMDATSNMSSVVGHHVLQLTMMKANSSPLTI